MFGSRMAYGVLKDWPLITVILVLWLTVGVLLFQSVKGSEGHFIYSLDDAYIHMGIAKNIVQHGVWGVTPFEFSSSSSSLLWPLLLSMIYAVFGIHAVVPLILNVIFATVTVLTFYKILQRYGLNRGYTCVATVAMMFLTPMPPLILGGMEHVLQILVAMMFVYLAAEVLSSGSANAGNRYSRLLLMLAPIVTSVRYEGVFMVCVVCLLFIVRGRWWYASCLGTAAIVPIGVYAIVSLRHGSFPLPNPLLIKAAMPDASSVIGKIKLVIAYDAYWKIISTPHVLCLTVSAIVFFLLRADMAKGMWERCQILIAVFVPSTFLHMELAGVGWLYRYEAYLVVLGVLIVAIASHELLLPMTKARNWSSEMVPRYVGLMILTPFVILPLFGRGYEAIRRLPYEAPWYYRMTYQMSRFVREFYTDVPIAVNDIGAISYFTDVYFLDLGGLGSVEVVKARREGAFNGEQVHKLAQSKGIRVAIISNLQGPGRTLIPAGWTKVGSWQITNGREPWPQSSESRPAMTEVEFYAVDESSLDALKARLHQFSVKLPSRVNTVMVGDRTEALRDRQ
jgi:hypothetical protein